MSSVRGRGRFTEPDSEHCCRCGLPVGVWWNTTDELWADLSGYENGEGVLCVGCFDEVAARRGIALRWEAVNAT